MDEEFLSYFKTSNSSTYVFILSHVCYEFFRSDIEIVNVYRSFKNFANRPKKYKTSRCLRLDSRTSGLLVILALEYSTFLCMSVVFFSFSVGVRVRFYPGRYSKLYPTDAPRSRIFCVNLQHIRIYRQFG